MSRVEHPGGHLYRDENDVAVLLKESSSPSGLTTCAGQNLLCLRQRDPEAPHLHAWQQRIELGNSEAIKHAAAEGLGLACLSEWVVAELLAARRLQRVPTTLPKMLRPCYIVLHRHKQRSPGLERLVALLLEAGSRKNAQPMAVGR